VPLTKELLGLREKVVHEFKHKEEIRMSCHKWVILVGLFCGTAAFGQSTPPSAHADLINGQGDKIGTATFVQTNAGVQIDLNVSQLPPGVLGIHLHAVGKCETPSFASAGGHLNPEMKKHGKNNPEGPHAGDLANIEVGADGKAKASFVNAAVTLADGPNSLFHEGGSSLVIHEKADDYKTDPTGNSGARIACGVIQK
jgi:superoxide dismutase, Cu-Zn family